MSASKTSTIVVRIIGCICMVGSAMVTTQIIADYIHRKFEIGKQIETVGIWTLHCSQYLRRGNHLAAMAVYTFLYSVSSGLVIISSYLKYRMLVLPWLMCEALCIVSDSIALVAIFRGKLFYADKWELGSMIFGLLFALLIWAVVYEAQRAWGLEKLHRASSSAQLHHMEQSLEQPLYAGTPRRHMTTKECPI